MTAGNVKDADTVVSIATCSAGDTASLVSAKLDFYGAENDLLPYKITPRLLNNKNLTFNGHMR